MSRDSVFQALSCSQWRHVFLEVYRVVESLFFLSWILDLKNVGSFQGNAVDLKAHCRAGLQWREKEKPSIERLFELKPPSATMTLLEGRIHLIKEVLANEGARRGAIGARIYAVRNEMVHHENYDEPAKHKPSHDEFRQLSLYLVEFLNDLIGHYSAELTSGSGGLKAA